MFVLPGDGPSLHLPLQGGGRERSEAGGGKFRVRAKISATPHPTPSRLRSLCELRRTTLPLQGRVCTSALPDLAMRLRIRALQSPSREARNPGGRELRGGGVLVMSLHSCHFAASLRAAAKQSSSQFPRSLDRFVSSFLAMTKKDMERRKTQDRNLRTLGCGAALGGSSPSGVPPRLFPRGVWSLGAIRARLRGQDRQRGGGHSADSQAHIQRRTSHAGRNAGRHDARTARERAANPPAGSASRPTAAICLRSGVLHGRDDRRHI